MYFDEHPIAMPGNKTSIVTTTRLPIRDQNGEPQYLLTVIEDRTQRKRDEARIAHMAHHDPLTDLPNRAAFNECLEAGESFAVLSLDLDRFKEINDVFGHTVGDELLRQIARRLEVACEGAFLARLGGDEFNVITAVGPQPATAEAISGRLSVALGKDIAVDGHPLHAGLTIGVSIYPNDGTDAESLVANADAALYNAKAEERGSIRFFEPDMDKRLREKRALQHDLRSAIARNELELYYQPQALIGGEITGFEALARWHHPSRGMTSPDTFIPLAEESGLIVSLGEWILREACREAASWPRPLSIAINLSPMQFRHGDLPSLVHEVLLETGLTPGRLELEITEGVLVHDFARAVSLLRRLKNLGVRIAMDDFGTGYSSLSYLQSFPFDKIKIDQSFIAKLSQNSQSEAIIRAVIGLGHGLDLPVVAEGVETEEQLAFLAKEGCNEMQGFLIGRPKPIRDYDELVGREKTRSASVARAS
jgi:diguanylate cyclase (GGDEF)-like protein